MQKALPHLIKLSNVKISQGDAELKGFVKCCCCCAAASAAPRSAINRGARSAMLIRDACAEIPEKNVPLRCSIYFIWRSGLTRGAGTKNSNSTSPLPLLLCCCCCATEKHCTTSSSFPTCKMSQGDAELKGLRSVSYTHLTLPTIYSV